MKNRLKLIFFLAIFGFACSNPPTKSEIHCSDYRCVGTYVGPEFIENEDIAHQFSNKICNSVGDHLKSLFIAGKYSKVDFPKIKMSTIGMGTGMVTYKISIPFIRVKSRCQAYTSFDHSGGWNHAPDLEERKIQLNNALLPNQKLVISPLFKTKEGLQEYWIQWKNKELQEDCIQVKSN